MAAAVLRLPLLPGASEAWRRLCQELLGDCRAEYAASRRRLGVTSERAWLVHTAAGELVVLYFDAADPSQVLPRFVASRHPFDRWLAEQLRELHGMALGGLPPALQPEIALAWDA